MLFTKKIEAQTQDEPNEEKEIDCVWATLICKRLGFETEEIKQMTWGECADYILTAAEMAKPKEKTEKKISALDL